MFTSDEYQLLDFGAGRKLERFGPYVLDRPSPAAANAERMRPELWPQAAARYKRTAEAGGWVREGEIAEPWTIAAGPLRFELKLTEAGHLGVFVEQAANWAWIAEQVRAAERPFTVLNLFAYTGGSTLAAAAAGASVVHVDAAANVVAWARRDAAASGLAERPIRWIAEDALRFARRELKRGRQYDAVILDPPAYGHGPRGEPWKLEEHLPELLDLCFALTSARRAFVLLTCHSGEFAAPRVLADSLREQSLKD